MGKKRPKEPKLDKWDVMRRAMKHAMELDEAYHRESRKCRYCNSEIEVDECPLCGTVNITAIETKEYKMDCNTVQRYYHR